MNPTEVLIFGLFVGVAVAETLMSWRWSPFYYRRGLQLLRIDVPTRRQPAAPPAPDELEARLATEDSSVAFRAVGPGVYGFRHKSRSVFGRTAPLMHGVLYFDRANAKVTVIGLVNWFFVPLSLLWIWWAIRMGDAIWTNLFLALVLVAMYRPQRKQFREVAARAAAAWSED
jgi:hypothetical protein